MSTRAVRIAGPAVTSDEPVARHAWVVLAISSFSVLMVGMSVTGLNLLFDKIGTEFDTSRSTLTWSLAGYSIVVAALLLPAGRMADRLGRRPVFRAGLAVFVVGSLLTAAAPGVGLFIAARLVQGIGAALLTPASLALVIPEFPASRHDTAVAGWAAMNYLGNGIAPSFTALVGGASWRWLFVFFGVVCAVLYVVTATVLPQREVPVVDGRVDLVGVPLGAVGVGLVALAIVEGPALGWTTPLVVASAFVAVVLLAYFVLRSLRHPQPLLDLRLFKSRAVWSANVANVFLSSAGIAIWLVYALFLGQVYGWSVMRTGLAMTPSPIAAGIATIIGMRLGQRIGERRLIELGSLLPVLGTAWLVWRLDAQANYLGDFLPGALAFSSGFGFTFAPLNAAALRDVPRDDLGQANAAFSTLRQLAGGVGTAVMVAILGDAAAISLHEFKVAFVVAAGMTLSCALVIGVAYPRHPHRAAQARR